MDGATRRNRSMKTQHYCKKASNLLAHCSKSPYCSDRILEKLAGCSPLFFEHLFPCGDGKVIVTPFK